MFQFPIQSYFFVIPLAAYVYFCRAMNFSAAHDQLICTASFLWNAPIQYKFPERKLARDLAKTKLISTKPNSIPSALVGPALYGVFSVQCDSKREFCVCVLRVCVCVCEVLFGNAGWLKVWLLPGALCTRGQSRSLRKSLANQLAPCSGCSSSSSQAGAPPAHPSLGRDAYNPWCTHKWTRVAQEAAVTDIR